MVITKKKCIDYLMKKRKYLQKNLEEDLQSLELTGEVVHYNTDEGFQKANEEVGILNCLLVLVEEDMKNQ